ncbi:hypothetical protein AAH991_38050 [Microbispora sp. ZYX-F-249]|uniref:HNH endonuclease n=1 Tax=Microbispora maris TaxID=3144104 RepID=A0ABV0B0E9_9ACTN
MTETDETHDLAETLRATIADLDAHIERRALQLAGPRILAAEERAAVAERRAEQAERNSQTVRPGPARPMPKPVDLGDRMWLCGDENGGVELHCRDCERGGRPLAYHHDHGGRYPDPTMPIVRTIPALIQAAQQHNHLHETGGAAR